MGCLPVQTTRAKAMRFREIALQTDERQRGLAEGDVLKSLRRCHASHLLGERRVATLRLGRPKGARGRFVLAR